MTNIEGPPAFSVRSDDVVARRLDDVVILINLKTNRIFELNTTGARLWELMSAGSNREEIRGAMLNEFDVSEADVAKGIDSLTAWLLAEGLLGNSDAG